MCCFSAYHYGSGGWTAGAKCSQVSVTDKLRDAGVSCHDCIYVVDLERVIAQHSEVSWYIKYFYHYSVPIIIYLSQNTYIISIL